MRTVRGEVGRTPGRALEAAAGDLVCTRGQLITKRRGKKCANHNWNGTFLLGTL